MVSTQERRVSPAKPADRLERPERGFLHNILGVGAASGKPSGEPEGIDEVGQEHLGKASLICRVVHIQPVEVSLPPV